MMGKKDTVISFYCTNNIPPLREGGYFFYIISIIFFSLLLSPAKAETVATPHLFLSGNFTEGGMVIGETEPGTLVRLGKQSVRVSPEGVFVLGFHREEKERIPLSLTLPDGTITIHMLSIRQRTYDIQRIDGLPPKKVTPPPETLSRIKQEAALVRQAREQDTPQTGFAEGFIWPLAQKGRISGVYGSQRILNGQPRQPHYGIDIAAPVGTSVLAPASGTVVMVHQDMYFSGGTMLLDHGHGVMSTFLHLETITVKKGQIVNQGETIATVGATGRATGPHLDWRVNWFDRRLDPALLLENQP